MLKVVVKLIYFSEPAAVSAVYSRPSTSLIEAHSILEAVSGENSNGSRHTPTTQETVARCSSGRRLHAHCAASADSADAHQTGIPETGRADRVRVFPQRGSGIDYHRARGRNDGRSGDRRR